MYQVKKKDTMYGIAKAYGITLEELVKANPDMAKEGYQLKKDDYIFIPYHKENHSTTKAKTPSVQTVIDGKRTVNIGVMLPLHDTDGDGKRMVEYYRGLLMACDSLKAQNISTNIRAWNVPADADIRQTLLQQGVEQCDLIFGPLYSKQVKPLADYCKTKKIKLVIPFSITGNDVAENDRIFQIYRSPSTLNEQTIDVFMNRFANDNCHPIFIDCNDTTSKKGIFTFALRKRLEAERIPYSITNLKSSEAVFAKLFSNTKNNIVILNTGRSPELNVALAKLDGLTSHYAGLRISLFGYTEWLMYTKVYLDYFHKYDTYVPTSFYFNPLSTDTRRLEQNYRRWFGVEMQAALPRFAITGYDHGQYFIRGLHRYGKSFIGTPTESTYKALQTPLHFERVNNQGGGMQNTSFMLVHYLPNHSIQTINY